MSGEIIRVLVADDHRLFVEGLTGLLGTTDNLRVIGSAATGAEAVDVSRRDDPDVVLMDVNMPGVDGIEATRQLSALCPRVRVLMLTMLDDDDSIFAAIRAGARGYLLKGANRAEVVRAVEGVTDGEVIFGPGIANRVLDYFSTRSSQADAPPFPELTVREREILDLIAAGKNNHDIMKQLYISPKTVRNHITNILAKLQVADRAEAIVRARRAGLGEPGAT